MGEQQKPVENSTFASRAKKNVEPADVETDEKAVQEAENKSVDSGET